MKNFWDERYGQDEYVYGKLPNEFLKEQLEKLRPGKILFPAEGEGRNAVYAAKIGWQVDAFDNSVEGKRKAKLLATENQVDINYVIDGFETFESNKKYDAIALIYTHMPSQIRTKFHSNVLKMLNPGGLVIMEAFNPNQLGNNSGGPQNVDMLYDIEVIKKDFEELELISAVNLQVILSEGAYHSGIADVMRYVGKKV